jgi:hypothetical protein
LSLLHPLRVEYPYERTIAEQQAITQFLIGGLALAAILITGAVIVLVLKGAP